MKRTIKKYTSKDKTVQPEVKPAKGGRYQTNNTKRQRQQELNATPSN